MSNLDNLLSRLHKVRKNGKDYVACCPAHDDGSPSMTISERDDGRILIHCFAGCETSDILASVGMEFKDIMPENVGFHRRKPDRRSFNALDVLYSIRRNASCILITAKDIQKGKVLTDEETLALAKQIGLIGMAISLAGGDK